MMFFFPNMYLSGRMKVYSAKPVYVYESSL